MSDYSEMISQSPENQLITLANLKDADIYFEAVLGFKSQEINFKEVVAEASCETRSIVDAIMVYRNRFNFNCLLSEERRKHIEEMAEENKRFFG